jgi:L-Ala-D/L-Glu epimerase
MNGMPTPTIRDVAVYRFNVRLKRQLRISTMALEHAANLMVKITSSDGMCGWGEASPFHSITGETQSIDIAAAGELRSLVMGKDPLEISARLSDLSRFLPHNATIRSAFDMALYDLAARTASMPLFRFLGGELRELETDITLYLGDPDEAAARAAQLVQDGFKIIKMKVGLDPAQDLEKVRAVRAAVGDTPRIRIDANQAWDRVMAVAMLRALEPYAIELCEQPCAASDHAALKHISTHSPIPIMADESLFSPQDALALDRGDVVPYFNIKLSKSGGIHAAQKIAHIAEAGGRLSMAGCMLESRLGVTAAVHFALAHPIIRFYDLDSFHEHAEDPIQGGVVAHAGRLIVPEEPGIGATPDESYLDGSQVIP